MRPGAGPVMGGRLGGILRQVSHMCPGWCTAPPTWPLARWRGGGAGVSMHAQEHRALQSTLWIRGGRVHLEVA